MNFMKYFKSHYKGIAVIFLLALPFMIFAFYTLRNAINVPMWDDYDAILAFLNSFITSATLKGKIGLIFQQHNEHRMILDKFFVLMQYFISGKVDFSGLILIGNSGYILLVSLIIIQLRKIGLTLFQLIPVPYLLFSFTHYENMFFATPSIQYYWSALFAFIFFIFLVDQRKLVLTCLLYGATVFTMGGGLILFPLGMIFLFLRKRWKHAVIFLISSTVFTLIYFYRFHTVASLPSLSASFVHLDITINYFLAFLGNAFVALDVATIVGLMVAIILMIFMINHYEESLLFTFSGWVLFMSTAISFSRSGLGINQALQSRYTIYSLIGFVCVYAWFIVTENKKGNIKVRCMAWAGIILCAAFFFGVLIKYQLMDQFAWERDIKINGLIMLSTRNQDKDLLYPNTQRPREVLLQSQNLGVYNYKETALNLQQKIDFQTGLPENNAPFQGNIDINDGSHLRGWAVIPGVGTSGSKIFILLKNNNGIFKLDTHKFERQDVSSFLGIQYLYDYSGYDGYIGAYKIPSGEFELGIMIENGNLIAIHWEGTKLDF